MTPETDAALYPMNGVDIVWPEFARELERERDEARTELAGCQAKNKRVSAELLVKLQDTERERDEAIRARDVALKAAHTYDEAHTKALEGWVQAERERDEAREIIRKAKVKFCEDGPDGKIAAEMFAILGSLEREYK